VTLVDAFTHTAMLDSPGSAAFASGARNAMSSTCTAAASAFTSSVKLGELPVTTGTDAASPEYAQT
jgi:hypothetical protein